VNRKHRKPNLKNRGKKLMSSLTNGDIQPNVQRTSTATCMVVTNYHNNSNDFIISWQSAEVNVIH
jgi:hypothetical protein